MRNRSGSAKAWSASARWRSRDPAHRTSPRDYIQITSGLGEAPPLNIIVLPVLSKARSRRSSSWPRSSASTRPTRHSSTS